MVFLFLEAEIVFGLANSLGELGKKFSPMQTDPFRMGDALKRQGQGTLFGKHDHRAGRIPSPTTAFGVQLLELGARGVWPPHT